MAFERRVEIMLENIEYWREAPVWNPASIAEADQGMVRVPLTWLGLAAVRLIKDIDELAAELAHLRRGSAARRAT